MRTRISPEAFTLLKNTLVWFKNDDHWVKGAWGVGTDPEYFTPGGPISLEKDQLRPDNQIEKACFAGGLLVNNNYEENDVYAEAVIALAELIDKSIAESDYEYSYDSAESRIVSYNDEEANSVEDVRSVLRRAISRFRRHN